MPRDPSLATVRPCSVIAVGVGANLIAGNASALAELTLKGFLLSLQVLLIEEEVLVLHEVDHERTDRRRSRSEGRWAAVGLRWVLGSFTLGW